MNSSHPLQPPIVTPPLPCLPLVCMLDKAVLAWMVPQIDQHNVGHKDTIFVVTASVNLVATPDWAFSVNDININLGIFDRNIRSKSLMRACMGYHLVCDAGLVDGFPSIHGINYQASLRHRNGGRWLEKRRRNEEGTKQLVLAYYKSVDSWNCYQSWHQPYIVLQLGAVIGNHSEDLGEAEDLINSDVFRDIHH